MIFLLFVLTIASAQGGEITGTVTLVTKEVPKRAMNSNPNRKRTVMRYSPKDRSRCRKNPGGLPKDEEVDERDFLVVYLSREKDGAKLECSPKVVCVDHKKSRIRDHVTPLTIGSKVRFTNLDNFFHHIYCPDSSALCVPEHAGQVNREPKRIGSYELFCDLHPKENAYLYVVPNDRFAQPKDGSFKITRVPPGEYVLKSWHPRLMGQSHTVTVGSEGTLKLNLEI